MMTEKSENHGNDDFAMRHLVLDIKSAELMLEHMKLELQARRLHNRIDAISRGEKPQSAINALQADLYSVENQQGKIEAEISVIDAEIDVLHKERSDQFIEQLKNELFDEFGVEIVEVIVGPFTGGGMFGFASSDRPDDGSVESEAFMFNHDVSSDKQKFKDRANRNES